MSRWWRWLLVVGMPLLLSCAADVPTAVDGWFAVTDWRPAMDGPVRLDGTWDFYWDELVPSQAFRDDEVPIPIAVPRFWHRTRLEEGDGTAGRGFGTYRLRVRLPTRPPPLALRFGNVNTAMAVYAQGRLVWSAGRATTDPDTAVPDYRPGVALLPPLDEPILDLVIHVSSFESTRGGLDDSVWLGTPDDLIAARTRSLAGLGLVVGGLLMMGLYHFFLFALQRRSRIALYFGLVCLAAVGRLAFTDELLIRELWPGLSWTLLVKGMYVSAFAVFGTFSLYLEALWPRAMPTVAYRGVGLFAAVSSLVVVATPVRFFARGLVVLEVFVLVCVVVAFVFFVNAMRMREEGRWIYAAGFACAAAGGVHDVVVSQGLISSALYLGPVGVFALLFAQSAILARRFSRSLTTVERQRGELQVMVDRFELEQRERKRYEELSLAASGLAHETKNPLGIIRGLAQRLVAAPDASTAIKRRAGQILDQADRAASRLGDFLSYARLRDPEIEPVDLGGLLRYAVEVLTPDLEAGQIPVETEADGVWVEADEEMLLQILLNLMLNAIAASGADNALVLRFVPGDDGACGRLDVIDHGSGIAPEMLDRVRQPYVTGRADGHGLGLALVERLVELHGWRLHIGSSMGMGTRVEIDGLAITQARNA